MREDGGRVEVRGRQRTLVHLVGAVSKCGAGGLSPESLLFYRSCLSELRIHLDPKSSRYQNALNATFIESGGIQFSELVILRNVTES